MRLGLRNIWGYIRIMENKNGKYFIVSGGYIGLGSNIRVVLG